MKKDINSIISELKSLDLSSYPIDKVRGLLSELKQRGLLITELNPGYVIYRMRQGFNYRTKEDISYNLEQNCTKCQRASLRGETVFYGIIVKNNNEQTSSAEYVGMCECSNLLWEENVEKSTEMITCGRWSVKKTLRLVSMVHPNVFPSVDNPLLNQIKKDYNKHSFNEGFNIIQEYICNEFSKPVDRKDDYNYLISALFTKRMITEYGFDGVLYPSQRAEGKVGLNVALSKTVVDNFKIELEKIYELKCFRYKKEMQCINERYIDYPSMEEHVVPINDDEIWKWLEKAIN